MPLTICSAGEEPDITCLGLSSPSGGSPHSNYKKKITKLIIKYVILNLKGTEYKVLVAIV